MQASRHSVVYADTERLCSAAYASSAAGVSNTGGAGLSRVDSDPRRRAGVRSIAIRYSTKKEGYNEEGDSGNFKPRRTKAVLRLSN